MSKPGYLGPQHPVAEVAGRLCRAHMGSLRLRQIGRTACGACWERAIRDDERAVVLFGLPREIESDPNSIDEIAVDLVCAGEPVTLTRAERAEVVRRLTARGVSAYRVAERLRMASRSVTPTRAAARRTGADAAVAPDGEAA